jgi:hypothetical protein
MIIQPSLPYGEVMFCDDIREEINDKLNFVGVYENGMTILGKLPVTIRQIFVWIAIRADPRKAPLSGKVKIIRSDTETEIFAYDFSFPPDFSMPNLPNEKIEPEQLVYTEVTLRVPLYDLYFDRACRLKVRAFSGDDEIRIGSLNITFDEQ